MKKAISLICLGFILSSCAPVLNRKLIREADRSVPLAAMKSKPEAFTGKLYALGGAIIDAKLMQNGSQLEVLAVPVDSYGNLEIEGTLGRVLAFYPSEKGLLDPVVFAKGREVTFAGTFTGLRQGKIDDMEYAYPLFEVRQIHLWEDRSEYGYYPYAYYPYSYYSGPYPYWYHPYWGPWPPPPGWW